MKTRSSFFRRGAWTLGAAVVFARQMAQACPGCKQAATEAGKTALNGVSIGFSLGVLFMICMVIGVLSGLGVMMYRSCKIISAQQRAQMEREDALLQGSLSSAGPA